MIECIFEKAVHQDSFMKAMKAILETLTTECKKISHEPQANIKTLTYKRSQKVLKDSNSTSIREDRLTAFNQILAQSISDLKLISESFRIGIGAVRDLAKHPNQFPRINKLRNNEKISRKIRRKPDIVKTLGGHQYLRCPELSKRAYLCFD